MRKKTSLVLALHNPPLQHTPPGSLQVAIASASLHFILSMALSGALPVGIKLSWGNVQESRKGGTGEGIRIETQIKMEKGENREKDIKGSRLSDRPSGPHANQQYREQRPLAPGNSGLTSLQRHSCEAMGRRSWLDPRCL